MGCYTAILTRGCVQYHRFQSWSKQPHSYRNIYRDKGKGTLKLNHWSASDAAKGDKFQIHQLRNSTVLWQIIIYNWDLFPYILFMLRIVVSATTIVWIHWIMRITTSHLSSYQGFHNCYSYFQLEHATTESHRIDASWWYEPQHSQTRYCGKKMKEWSLATPNVWTSCF